MARLIGPWGRARDPVVAGAGRPDRAARDMVCRQDAVCGNLVLRIRRGDPDPHPRARAWRDDARRVDFDALQPLGLGRGVSGHRDRGDARAGRQPDGGRGDYRRRHGPAASHQSDLSDRIPACHSGGAHRAQGVADGGRGPDRGACRHGRRHGSGRHADLLARLPARSRHRRGVGRAPSTRLCLRRHRRRACVDGGASC